MVAVSEAERITQQNNEIAEQFTSWVSTLQQLAEQLNHKVDLFRLQDKAPSHTEPSQPLRNNGMPGTHPLTLAFPGISGRLSAQRNADFWP